MDTPPTQFLCVAALMVALAASPAAGQAEGKLREPLPLDVAASLRVPNGRNPINFSPDGQWIAHTVEAADTVPRATMTHSPTGFPFEEGDSRMEATLSNLVTGKAIRLGGLKSCSWAPVWSPDGRRVAFYSDEDGSAGVWIWEKATGKAHRFPGVIARNDFGFEGPRWTSNSQRLLCKILPAGITVAQANATDTQNVQGLNFPNAAPGRPAVLVRSCDLHPKPDAIKPAPRRVDEGAELAILDLPSHRVTRLTQRIKVRYYAFSPDEKWVAYTVRQPDEPNTQQSNFELDCVELSRGRRRTLATHIRINYGIEWNWSPDSKKIAYLSCGGMQADGKINVISLADGSTRSLGERAPSFKTYDGGIAPLWDARGENLYAVGGGNLWRVEAASGQSQAVTNMIRSGFDASLIVNPFCRPTICTPDGHTAWILAGESKGNRRGLFGVDLSTGEVRSGLLVEKSIPGVYNLDISDKTGEIAFLSTDQQHPWDVWSFNPKDGRERQASHLNPGLEPYELGTGKIIEWKTEDGQALRGALLLPPGYQAGRRLPLVVWVYGNVNGSNRVNEFGLEGSVASFNFHVLATRGYAVLHPDAPIRAGMQMKDLMRAVLPGVDAAIAQGYADPDRLAVMGNSYGAYCTLDLITQTRRFKAAVITAAVTHPDLFAAYCHYPAGFETGQGNMHASIWEKPDIYRDNSPLFLFDRIETPILMGDGEKDGLVASDAIFTALERLKKSVEYRVYKNEGHIITQPVNVLDFWQRRLDFLAEHLNLALDPKGGIVFESDKAKSR